MGKAVTSWPSWGEMVKLLHYLKGSSETFDVLAIEGPDDRGHRGFWWLAIIYGEGDPGALLIPRGEPTTDLNLSNIAADLRVNPDIPASAVIVPQRKTNRTYAYHLREVTR